MQNSIIITVIVVVDPGGNLFIAILVALSSFNASAADLSATEVYAKCHARLSDHPVNIDSAAYKRVAEGTLDPITACTQLLNRADFASQNNQKTLKDPNDKIAVSTLRNFQQFHQSWFTSFASVGLGTDRALYNFVDHSEPALYITDALFGGRPYQSIFTRRGSIRGIRRGESSSQYVIGNTRFENRVIFSGPLDGNVNNTATGNAHIFNFPRVPLGQLIGLEPAPSMSFRQQKGYTGSNITESQWPSLQEEGVNHNLRRHFGGGILGTAAYLVFNAEAGGRLDGGVRVHRRLATNTFNDLMCANLPNLNDGDVDAYLNKYKNSKISFRTDRSCARCHATLDPFADTFRNVFLLEAHRGPFRIKMSEENPAFAAPNRLRYPKQFKVRTNRDPALDEDDIYHRRAPKGQLFYRNFNGNLINVPVTGIDDLGKKIAARNDPYVCAAQRYYGFLTGVHIQVSSPESDAFYQRHRAEIVKMGRDLKEHQSLKKLIVEILKSEAFQTRFPGYELSPGGAE